MRISNPDVIIGAGFTGAALAIRLLQTLPDGARLLLLGTPHATGKGYAYGTDLADHLLNVRAGRMSVISDEPQHFINWLRQHGHRDDGLAEGYAPRPVYGAYVRDTLFASISRQRGRLQAEVHEATVIGLDRHAGGFSLQFADGGRAKAKAVILAMGTICGDFPFVTPADTADVMIRDPFTDHRMRTIDRDARVLLVDTGLTMVDQLLRLEAAGHRGPVLAISRHGLLPAAHPERPRAVRQSTLPAGASLGRLVRSLISDAQTAIRERDDWQSVLDGLRPHVQRLWRELTLVERARFLRHAEAFGLCIAIAWRPPSAHA